MSDFTLPISCPDCGGPVELVNGRSSGSLLLAIVVCSPCGWEYEVIARIGRHAHAATPQARKRAVAAERKARQRASVS